jgi:RNA polymerase sigma factor (sigma-70 family)
MENLTGSDAALVGAFCDAANDEARQQAFSVLLQRHGAMVLGTCRRVIGNHSDAEDAAQAVFITLAAKARQLREHPTIGGWLHRSARHIAMRQRDAARTRTRYEGNQEAQAMMAPPDTISDHLRHDLREELDHALDHLAERYRVPLVLHYLDGHSQEEVARILHMKEGTLASLLSRGRELLRQQLQRKGVAVGAISLTTLLVSEGAANAALPNSFILATAKSASAIAAGSFSTAAAAGTAAPHVLALASGGGITLTTFGSIKLVAASLLAASALSLGTVAAINFASEPRSQTATINQVTTTDQKLISGTKTGQTSSLVTPSTNTPSSNTPTPSTINNSTTTAEKALQISLQAMRKNDVRTLLQRLDPEGQQRAQESWHQIGQFVSNPFVSGLFSRLLSAANEPNAGKAVATYVAPFLNLLDANPSAGQNTTVDTKAPSENNTEGGLAQMAINNTASSVMNNVLASGLENEQTLAMKNYLGALAAWLPSAGFTNPEKAQLASEAIGEALKKFGAIHLSDLTNLELGQFLDRVSLALPDLKRAFAVYDLQIDRALDSVTMTSTTTTDATIVRMTFTAFNTTHTFPLKLVEHQQRWSIIGDSPLPKWQPTQSK